MHTRKKNDSGHMTALQSSSQNDPVCVRNEHVDRDAPTTIKAVIFVSLSFLTSLHLYSQ
jgi:hypothetical protein